MARESHQCRTEHGRIKRAVPLHSRSHTQHQSKMYNTCGSPALLVLLLERRRSLLIADRRNLLPCSLEGVPEVLMLEAGVRDCLLQVLDDSRSQRI